MQSQLEIMQQSADIYMSGAYVTNRNIEQDGGSFAELHQKNSRHSTMKLGQSNGSPSKMLYNTKNVSHYASQYSNTMRPPIMSQLYKKNSPKKRFGNTSKISLRKSETA